MGFELFDARSFWVGKFNKNFFGWHDLSREFWGYSFHCIALHLFHQTGYTIVHKVSWGVSNKASIHSTDFSSIVFILTGIPFCCSGLLISFACDLWVNPCWKFLRLGNLTWDFWGVNFSSRDFFGFVESPRDFFGF